MIAGQGKTARLDYHPMKDVVLIVDNIRSSHNVGSLFRTAEGLGIESVMLTGYTPYPETDNDARLPHIAKRISKRINKTSLGAESLVNWQRADDILEVLEQLHLEGYQLAALEQTATARPLNHFTSAPKIGLVVGNEVSGISQEVADRCDVVLEIPMHGRKESFNVAAAAAMALYHLTLLDKPSAKV